MVERPFPTRDRIVADTAFMAAIRSVDSFLINPEKKFFALYRERVDVPEIIQLESFQALRDAVENDPELRYAEDPRVSREIERIIEQYLDLEVLKDGLREKKQLYKKLRSLAVGTAQSFALFDRDGVSKSVEFFESLPEVSTFLTENEALRLSKNSELSEDIAEIVAAAEPLGGFSEGRIDNKLIDRAVAIRTVIKSPGEEVEIVLFSDVEGYKNFTIKFLEDLLELLRDPVYDFTDDSDVNARLELICSSLQNYDVSQPLEEQDIETVAALIALDIFGVEFYEYPDENKIREKQRAIDRDDPSYAEAIETIRSDYNRRVLQEFLANARREILFAQGGGKRVLADPLRSVESSRLITAETEENLRVIFRAFSEFDPIAVELELIRLFDSEDITLTQDLVEETLAEFTTFSSDDFDRLESLRRIGYDLLRQKNKEKFLKEYFLKETLDEVLDRIRELPKESAEDMEFRKEIIDLYGDFLFYRSELGYEDDYDEFKSRKVELLRGEDKANVELPELSRGRKNFTHMRELQRDRLDILRRTMIGSDGDINEAMAKWYQQRKSFKVDYRAVAQKRDLTPAEKAWYLRADLASHINPHYMAMALTAPELVRQYLDYLHQKLFFEAQERLEQGPQFFHTVVVGLGPHGVTAQQIFNGINPEVSDGVLSIDGFRAPGGALAKPEGASFMLNSGPARSPNPRNVLRDRPGDNPPDIQTLGNPSVAIPGERPENSLQRRKKGINLPGPLPTDNDLAGGPAYASNEAMELAVQLQAATTIPTMSLRTELVSVEDNNDPDLPGDKLLTLAITDPDGNVTYKGVVTQHLIIASGLGKDFYGFDTGSGRSLAVFEASSTQTEPIKKVMPTLEFFRGMRGRFEKEPGRGLGETILIAGKNNSFNTVAELLTGIYVPEKESAVATEVQRTVKKIYAVAPGGYEDFKEFLATQRPRYSALSDFLDRGDTPELERLISFVDARITDVEFVDRSGPVAERKLRFYDENDQIIRARDGQEIQADNAIFTTGFRSTIDQIFEGYSGAGTGAVERKPYTLPDGYRVGETLTVDPNTLFLGSAVPFARNKEELSRKLDDIGKISETAVDALLRVGVDNFVALGLLMQDTTAAMTQYALENRENLRELHDEMKKNEQSILISASVRRAIEGTVLRNPEVRFSRHLSSRELRQFMAAVVVDFLQNKSWPNVNREYIVAFRQNDQDSLVQELVEVHETEIDTSESRRSALLRQVRDSSKKIHRGSLLRRGREVSDRTVPTQIRNLQFDPYLSKGIKKMIATAESGEVRLRISIRNGKLVPERVKMVKVNSF